jgi:hypothetical protein
MQSTVARSLGLVTVNALACMAIATPAHADPWRGPYAGVSAGAAGIENVSAPSTMLAIPIPPAFFGSADGDGASFGGMAGYRWRIDRAVVGLEADADVFDAGAEKSSAIASLDVDAQWSGGLRVTAGAPVGPALIYGAFGATVTEFDYQYRLGTGAPTRVTDTAAGWTGAVGVEWAAGRFHPRIEYRTTEHRTLRQDAIGFSFAHDPSVQSLRFALVAPLGGEK